MLKTETQTFGAFPPTIGPKGEVLSPGRPGVEITSTQMPCSAQREVFAWLLEQAPGSLPPGLVGGAASKSEAGLNFAYQWLRGILSAKGGIAYLQKQFGTRCVARVERDGKSVLEPLDEGLCDELFGAQMSILMEWLVFNLIFNFADVLNILPDWGKGIPSIMAAVMLDGMTPETAKPKGEGSAQP